MKLFKVNLRCLYSRRRLAVYADGEVPRRTADRIENHLVDCVECRAMLLRLREGQRFASQVPRRSLVSDQWAEIEALIAADGKESPAPAGAGLAGGRGRGGASLAPFFLPLVPRARGTHGSFHTGLP